MLLDLTEVPCIDFTTTRALEDIITDTRAAGQQVFLVGACNAVRKMHEQQKVLQYIETNNVRQQRMTHYFMHIIY